jgi:hypothetical protein
LVFQAGKKVKEKLSGFPPFKLNSIQNGNIELVLCDCKSTLEFNKMAVKFVKAI